MYNSFTVHRPEEPAACPKPPDVPPLPPDVSRPPAKPEKPAVASLFSDDFLLIGLVIALLLTGKRKDTLLLAALAYVLL